MVDGVARGIGDVFDFPQLDAIIYRCTGEHRINGWTNDRLPRWTIARNCIDGAEKQGLIVLFLAYVLSALPPSGTLYLLIIQAMPQAKDALPEVKSQVEEVRAGLERTRSLLNDPAARATIEQSRQTLTNLGTGISLLDGYKGLHDCLHSLQVKQISLLIASSTKIASDSLQHNALREYKDQVRTQVQCARDVIDKLPDDAALRSVETKWIDELDTASRFLQKSLDDRNPNAARIGIIRMSRVLQFQPPRLNDLIVAAATELPLQKLSVALGNLAAAVTQGASDLTNAEAALSRLDQAVRGRVAEHDLWQEIDKQIWVIEQLFSDTVDTTDAFMVAWPDLKTPLRTMADLSPAADWSRNVKEYSDRIDVELLRLQSPNAVVPIGTTRTAGLFDLFASLRSESRLRFFVVDQQLRRDCESLVAIGAPVKGILEMLDHG
ncbi:hypothetical protein WN73_21510 [Bradyrhizobium sp. CCBAU 45394]|nr:hypothetical protein [Bradyrhizobium sp. CCBAU 45394]